MDKNIIKLTESELKQIIAESIDKIINENEELAEGWLSDKWNQAKSAATTMMNNNGSLKNKIQNAKTNWKQQGEINNINNLRQQLINFVEAGQLNPNMTIGQLIGGKYNNNRFGRMNGMVANRKSQISRKGGNSY